MTARVKLEVEYDDGRTDEVIADGRDIVKLEDHLKMGWATAMRDRTVNATRFLAWAALKRQGKIPDKVKLDEWSNDVPSVRFDLIDPVGPGKTEAPDAPESS